MQIGGLASETRNQNPGGSGWRAFAQRLRTRSSVSSSASVVRSITEMARKSSPLRFGRHRDALGERFGIALRWPAASILVPLIQVEIERHAGVLQLRAAFAAGRSYSSIQTYIVFP